ncbi:MAG TPA: homoserine kinase, partial [Thermoanaerobaculia bacterium]|jgi:homoserine kinase
MGGSAASAVGGAYAAGLAAGLDARIDDVMRAALEAEATAAGRHLDNIAPSMLGGLALVRSVDPIDVIRIDAPQQWAVVLVKPGVQIKTAAARKILPETWDRGSWIQQMANTAALAYAFAAGDAQLVGRALDDRYAEPLRAPMIPNFAAIKRAALDAGALGCSISGSGPTIFAITRELDPGVAEAMRSAAGGACDVHVGRIARQGARPA